MNKFGYVIEVLDKVSAPIAKMQQSFAGLQNEINLGKSTFKTLTKGIDAAGNSIKDLREYVQQLKGERDLLPMGSIEQVRAFNLAIKETERHIHRLENVNGGAMSKIKTQLGSVIPQAEFLLNPYVALGAGLVASVQMAAKFEQGMAKINTTAELSKTELGDLGDELKDMALDAGYADLSGIPQAFENIISKTSDVAQSKKILALSLKGAVAGFADVNTVAEALTKSMSQLGKDSGITEERLANVLFAAKRVGAGEMDDFAKHIPQINAAAMDLEISLEESAAAFSFLTAKGIDAAEAGTLLRNAYSALHKPDVRNGLAGIGVALEDSNGKARDMEFVIGDLSAKLKGLSVNQRINLLDSIGLRDAQAVSAVSLLTSDFDKLQSMMKAIKNPVDEIANSFGNSEHTMRNLDVLMSRLQVLMLDIGSYVLPVLNIAIVVATEVFDTLSNAIGEILDWLPDVNVNFQEISEVLEYLEPLIDPIIIAMGILGTIMIAQSFGAIVATVANWGLVSSFVALTVAIQNIPLLGWVLAIVGALIIAYQTSSKFKAGVLAVLDVVGALAKKLWYIFTGNWKAAMEVKVDYKESYKRRLSEVEKEKQAEKAKKTDPLKAGGAPGEAGDANKEKVKGITNEATGGGNKVMQVNITLGSLVEQLQISTVQFDESVEEAEAKLTEMMIRVLNQAQLRTN